MVLDGAGIYANIWGILMYIDGKCYHIWHTWILWDMGMGQNWVPKNTWMLNAVDAKNIEK